MLINVCYTQQIFPLSHQEHKGKYFVPLVPLQDML